jgi:hypothetical protein
MLDPGERYATNPIVANWLAPTQGPQLRFVQRSSGAAGAGTGIHARGTVLWGRERSTAMPSCSHAVAGKASGDASSFHKPASNADYPWVMQESPVQILEVRAGEAGRPVTITAAITADASRAIFTALSEQLDRRRKEPASSVEDVLAFREHIARVERFEPLTTAGAVICLSGADLRSCLLELTDYADRVDDEHFQTVELRERLRVIAQVTRVLWDANADAAAAGGGTGELFTHVSD